VILSSAALRKLLSLQFTLVPLPIFRHSVTWTFRLFSTVTCG
jgi:hypothetical protein